MRRLISILLILSIFNISVKAKNTEGERPSRLTYGLEWGYSAAVFSGFHYNYFAPEGFRMDEFGNSFIYRSNAEAYLNVGYNLSDIWNIAVYAGYAGVSDLHKAIPISFRGTRFFGDDPAKDRWFAFMDLGTGICLKKPVQEIFSGKIGCGFRMALSQTTGLDFIFAVKTIYTHPYIYYDGIEIPFNKTNRNDAYISSLSLGLALYF